MVVSPVRDAGVKHVEFVSLGADETLAVIVFEDGSVENRLMKKAPGITPNWSGRGASSTKPPRGWSRTGWRRGAAARTATGR